MKKRQFIYRSIRSLAEKAKLAITKAMEVIPDDMESLKLEDLQHMPEDEQYANKTEPLFLIIAKGTQMIVGAYEKREIAEFEMIANRHSKLPLEALEIQEVRGAPSVEREHLLNVYKFEPTIWH